MLPDPALEPPARSSSFVTTLPQDGTQNFSPDRIGCVRWSSAFTTLDWAFPLRSSECTLASSFTAPAGVGTDPTALVHRGVTLAFLTAKAARSNARL